MTNEPQRDSASGRSLPSQEPVLNTPDAEALDEDVRTKQALLTAIVVLVLFGVGFWLVQEFHKSISAQQCLEQGRRNCPAAEIRTR